MEIPAYLASDLVEGQRRSVQSLRSILDAFGRPERRIPSLLIGGTNGKGSTQAFLAAMLRASGHRVGTFTSPAMLDFHDQIATDEGPISAEEAQSIWEEARSRPGTRALTLFEAATFLAFEFFARRRVDIALIEVGLGGAHDATNLADPMLSLVTEIDRDHCAILGSTLDAIAEEKAGIARPGRRLLSMARGRAGAVLKRTAEAIGAHVEDVPRFARLERTATGWRYRSGTRMWDGMWPRLNAPYQEANGLLAIRALEHLESMGFSIHDDAAKEGFCRATLPGRCEWLRQVRGLRILFDGAHNPHGARGLLRSLPPRRNDSPRVLILSIFSDKDIEGIVEELGTGFDLCLCTTSGAPRALSPHRLSERVRRSVHYPLDVISAPSPARALETAAAHSPDLIVAAGTLSLYRPLRALGFVPEPSSP